MPTSAINNGRDDPVSRVHEMTDGSGGADVAIEAVGRATTPRLGEGPAWNRPEGGTAYAVA